jgi:hypothetical protein
VRVFDRRVPVSGLREIAVPFVAAAPAGARVRTRLRVSPEDAVVLEAAGRHLGSLAGGDLAARCAEGRLDAKGRAASRRARKRSLTAGSSSRWAGAITRTSEDAWQLAERNLRAGRQTLRARIRRIEARLAVPAGGREGHARGYGTQAERHGKQHRLQALKARLQDAEQRIAAGRVSVCRGGCRLAKTRHNLEAAGLTETQWRRWWDAERLFLTADGEAGKAWGNETIRWNPDEGWLEVKLPARWGTWRTGRTAATGCPAPSGSRTGAVRWRRRPLPARSATTSVRHEAHCEYCPRSGHGLEEVSVGLMADP